MAEIVPVAQYREQQQAAAEILGPLTYKQSLDMRLRRKNTERMLILNRANALSPELGSRVRGLLYRYPGMSPQGFVGLMELRDDPESDIIARLAALDADVSAREWAASQSTLGSPNANGEAGAGQVADSWNPMDLVRGVSRTIFDVGEGIARVIPNAIRGAYGEISEEGDVAGAFAQLGGVLPPVAAGLELGGVYGDRPNPWEQTTFGQSIYSALGVPEEGGTFDNLRIGEEESLMGAEAQGDGWFVDPESDIAQAQRRAVRKAAPLTQGGEAWTLGRGATDALNLDPDSTRYRMLSGFIDAAAILALDPLMYAGGIGAVGKGRAVTRAAQARSEAAVGARETIQAGKDEATRLAEAQRKRAEAYLAEARAGKTKYVDVPMLNQVLEDRRNEQRALAWLADARTGAAKYGAIDSAGRLNVVRRADLDTQSAELTAEVQRLQLAKDLIEREAGLAKATARTRVEPQLPRDLDDPKIVDDVVYGVMEMRRTNAKVTGMTPAQSRAQRLTLAFNEGIDPDLLRDRMQTLGVWRQFQNNWNVAYRAFDRDAAQRARATRQTEAARAEATVDALSPGEIGNALRDLTTANNFPGTVVYNPTNLPYSRTPNAMRPFESADDVYPALVNGEPSLVRLPKVEMGQKVRVADEARAAEKAPRTATHAIVPMGMVQMGKYAKKPTLTNLSLRVGEKSKRDVPLDEAQEIMGSVTRAYDQDGNLVEITGWRFGEIDARGKIIGEKRVDVADTGARTLEDLTAEKVQAVDTTPRAPTVDQPRQVRVIPVFEDGTSLGVRQGVATTREGAPVLEVGEKVRVGAGTAEWTVSYVSKKGNRVTVTSPSGQKRSMAASKVSRVDDKPNFTSIGALEGTEDDVARLIDEIGDAGVGRTPEGLIDDIPVDRYRVDVLDDGQVVRTTFLRRGEEYTPSQQAAQVRGLAAADDTIEPAVWRDVLSTLPPAITDPKGKTALADLARANGGPITWKEVFDVANRFDVVSELAVVMLRNGVLGISGFGRTKAQTWIPESLGASSVPINVASRSLQRGDDLMLPPEVVQAQARAGRTAWQLTKARDQQRLLAQELRDLDMADAANARRTREVWETVEAERKAIRDKARSVTEARRDLADAGLQADELEALALATARDLKDVLVPRTIDGSKSLDISGVAALLDPQRMGLSRMTGTVVDRMMRRMGGENMIRRLVDIKNTNHLNRLFGGRLDQEQLLRIADIDDVDEMTLYVQSLLDVAPDQLQRMARSSQKAFVGRKAGGMGDRIARSMEIVSARNPLIDLNQPAASATALNAWLRTIGMDQDWIDARVDKFIRANTAPERANILFRDISDSLNEDLLRKAGTTADTPMGKAIRKHSRIVDKQFSDVKEWFASRTANGGHLNGGYVDGEWVPFHDGPHLPIELADSTLRLPDVTELRRLNTAIGRKIINSPDTKTLAETMLDRANRINDLWRTWLLIRGAYVLRNIAETQMRTYVMGSHNAFTNPLMFLGMVTSTSTSKPVRALRPFVQAFDRYNVLSPGVDMDYFAREVMDPEDITRSGDYANAAARSYSESVWGGTAPQDFRAVSATVNAYEPRLMKKGDSEFRQAHARELLTLRNDPFAAVVAGDWPDEVAAAVQRGTSPEDAIMSWVMGSDRGREIRRMLQETSKDKVAESRAWDNADWVRGYLFEWPGSVRKRIEIATASDERLLGFLRDGTLRSVDGDTLWVNDPMIAQRMMAKMSPAERRKFKFEQERDTENSFAKAITQVFSRDNLPDDAQFSTFVLRAGEKKHMDRAADWFFNWSGNVEKLAAWNPEFRIAFIRNSLNYLDSMHPRDAIEWLDAVTPHMPKVRALRDMPGTSLVGGKANFKKLYDRQRKRLEEIGDETSEAFLTKADLESMAGAAASAHNKNLFYAAINQGNFWHAARFAIPFGQPTVNAYRVFGQSALDWTRLTTRHWPAVKGFQGAQSEGSSVINEAIAMLEPGNELGFTDLDDDGVPIYNRPFLYREDEGEPLKFRYPLAGSMLGGVADTLLPGDPGFSEQDMTGYVSGLNLALQGVQPVPEASAGEQVGFIAANLIPSVGWTVQTAASWLPIDEQYGPGWDLVNRWIFPFGRPDDDQSDAVVNLLPTWAKRGLVGALGNGETSARWRATNMKGVMGWHASRDTGTNWLTPQGKEDLLARSDRDARVLTFLQALGAFFFPTAPTWAYEAIDEDGSAYAQVFIADEWRQIREKTPDWDTAVVEFMDRFGEGVTLVPGVTSSTAGEPTLSTAAWDALQENGDLRAYRQVLPYFFPGDIDWVAYEWQRQQGYRQSLSPEERVQEAHRLVYQMQDAALTARADATGMSDEEVEAEREVLKDRWPTGRPKGTRQYMTSEEKLELVRSAIEDVPELASTQVGQVTIEALERLDFWTEVGGNKTLTGKTVAEERMAFLEEVAGLFGPIPGGDEMRRLFNAVVKER